MNKKILIAVSIITIINTILIITIICAMVISSKYEVKQMIINTKNNFLVDEKFRCLEETGKTDCDYVKDVEEQLILLRKDYLGETNNDI